MPLDRVPHGSVSLVSLLLFWPALRGESTFKATLSMVAVGAAGFGPRRAPKEGRAGRTRERERAAQEALKAVGNCTAPRRMFDG